MPKMLEGDKILSENTCCLCLNDEESTFSANTTMKSMPLHEMVNFCIGVQVSKCVQISNKFKAPPHFNANFLPYFIQ